MKVNHIVPQKIQPPGLETTVKSRINESASVYLQQCPTNPEGTEAHPQPET